MGSGWTPPSWAVSLPVPCAWPSLPGAGEARVLQVSTAPRQTQRPWVTGQKWVDVRVETAGLF